MEFGDYRYPIEENYKNTLRDFSDFEGLEELMKEILDLRDSKIYGKTILAYNRSYPYDSDVDRAKMVRGLVKDVLLFKLAKDNLSHFPLSIPRLTGLIDLDSFSTVITLFEFLYYRKVGRLLNSDDLERIDSSVLNEKVIFALDEFYTVSSVPEPTDEFFKKLRKIKWGNKTRGLWLDINGLRAFAGFPPEKTPARFLIEHDLLTQFLAACSAVNNNRDKIEQKDVIMAYKTYFKLIKTDLPALIDKLPGENKV